MNTETFPGIEIFNRYILPGLVIAFLFVMSVVPMHIPYYGPVRPYFMLMGVFFFAVYRPTLMPPSLAFFLGLLIDLLSFTPLGMTSLVLVAVQWIAREQRKFILSQSFLLIWTGFALLVLASCALQWGMFSLIQMKPVAPGPVAVSAVLSVFLFPPVALLMFFVHRIASAAD